MSYCVVLQVRDEDHIINEFIAYYLLIGFDHFYIYDNESKIPVGKSIKPKFKKHVTINDIPGSSPSLQFKSINHFKDKYSKRHQWAAVLDADEFIVLRKHKNIQSFVQEFPEDTGAIHFHWLTFGHNNLQKLPKGLVMQNFFRCSTRDHKWCHEVKSIVKIDAVSKYMVHIHEVKEGYTRREVDKSVSNVRGIPYSDYNESYFDTACIFHYRPLSIDMIEKKRLKHLAKKNRPANHHTLEWYDSENLNESADLYLKINFAHKVQRLIFNSEPKFYSQQNEDRIIYQEFFKDRPFQETSGRVFIELGGYDGVTYSNTKFFEDELNWKGVLIEPIPKAYEKMVKARPLAQCYNYAIDYEEGKISFLGEEPTGGILKYMPKKHQEIWYKGRGKKYKVETKPLKTILNDAGLQRVDLFSIDTEGAEKVVLDTFDWSIPVYLVLIELTHKDLEVMNYCRNLLLKKGFTFFKRIGNNDLWLNKDYPFI